MEPSVPTCGRKVAGKVEDDARCPDGFLPSPNADCCPGHRLEDEMLKSVHGLRGSACDFCEINPLLSYPKLQVGHIVGSALQDCDNAGLSGHEVRDTLSADSVPFCCTVRIEIH